MTHIDRYELSLHGHQRLIDAHIALIKLQALLDQPLGVQANAPLTEQVRALTMAVSDTVTDARPVDGLNSFLCEAGRRDFISLAPRERVALNEVRCCSEEGIKDIFKMIHKTVNQKPRVFPQQTSDE